MKKSFLSILGLLFLCIFLITGCNFDSNFNQDNTCISGKSISRDNSNFISANIQSFNSDTKYIVLNTNVLNNQYVTFIFNGTKMEKKSTEGKVAFNLSYLINEDVKGGTKYLATVSSYSLEGEVELEIEYLPSLIVKINDKQEKPLFVEDIEEFNFPSIKVNYEEDTYSVNWSIHYKPGNCGEFDGINLLAEGVTIFTTMDEFIEYVKDEDNIYDVITICCSVTSNINQNQSATAIQIRYIMTKEDYYF